MYRNLKYIAIAFLSALTLSSCESYLEKTQASDLSDSQIFGSYRNFQGYLDELYGRGLIKYYYPNPNMFTVGFDCGDDVYCNKAFPVSYSIPSGNYMWIWQNTDHNPFVSIKPKDSNDVGLWDQGLVNIRRCNHALANLDLLSGNTDEEYALLKGQALFFRAWNHFEICKFWGGLPYIDKYLGADDDLRLPRLTFRQTLLRVAEDFQAASELLPEDWNNTTVGSAAPGTNTGRATRGAALALKSRALLYAASPLATKMETGQEVSTSDYDLELLEEAAKAAYEVIKLADKGVYALVPWDQYGYQFADARPGTGNIWTSETIFSKIVSAMGSGQYTNGIGRVHGLQRMGGNGVVTAPTVNFINLYETATGYAIKDAPAGDYNTILPWSKRDPRMLKTILVDGVKWVEKLTDASAYVQLYQGGADRNAASGGSVTGYFVRKYTPYKVNNKDNGAEWNNFRFMCPFVRLAEMYLNYAEAVNEIYGPSGTPAWSTLTAVEAVNTIRRRVKLPENEDVTKPAELMTCSDQSLPDVRDIYTDTKEHFRDRIRNERSVELAFEGHRFVDMRRWYLAHHQEYKVRYAAEFDKGHTYYKEVRLFEGPFDEKHYWFPFKPSDAQQYEGFKQNPGW